MSSLCACCTPASFRFSRIIAAKSCPLPPASSFLAAGWWGSINSSFSSTPSVRCGERLSTVNGPATRTFFLSSYGLSYRYSNSALAAIDASISFCRWMRCPHQRVWASFASADHFESASRGISHSSHFLPRALLSAARSGSSRCWNFSQITSISALFAMLLSVTCGTRS